MRVTDEIKEIIKRKIDSILTPKIEARLKELRKSIPNDIILKLTLGASKADFERILNKHLVFSQKL